MAPARTTTHPHNAVTERSEYPLKVQKKAMEVAQSIQARSMVNTATWSSPLAAAPSAVSTMAILLKTSASDVAAGVPVKSREVRDDNGKIIMQLPQDLLYANLQFCSDRGGAAFANARSTMSYINKIASKMIENRGDVESILRAINRVAEDEDDEDDDDDDTLEDDIQNVRDSTKGCLERIHALTDSFQNWYWVIECLKENVVACQGETRNEANQNDDSRQKKAAEKDKLAEKGASTSEVIEALQLQLKDAERRVSEAEAHVKALEGTMPVITDLSPEEERLLAEKAIPLEERKKGIWNKFVEKIAGESTEEYRARMDHQRDVEQRRAELIKQKREQRDAEKREAQRRLEAARSHEKALNDKMTKLIADVGKNKEKLASAMASLDIVEAQFKRLSERRLQLEDVLIILKESSRQLGELRRQVQDLVKFFKDILNEVDVVVGDVGQFLGKIEKKMRYDSKGHFTGVEIKKNSNYSRRIHDSAEKIQGSFCAIREITAVYVLVSDRYIIPAIDRMGTLADATDEEWPARRDDFTSWCRQSMAEIQALAKTTEDSMVSHMTERLQHLQLAIEPAH